MKNGPDARLEAASAASNLAAHDQAAAQNGFSVSGSAGASAGTSRALDESPTASLQGGLSLSGPMSTKLDLTASHSLPNQTVNQDEATKLSASAGMSLWDGYPGGRGLASLRQADLTLRSNQLDHEARMRTLVYTLKKAYYSMLVQQRQLVVLKDTLSKRQNELAKVQIMFDNNGATRIDLRQARINAASAQIDLDSARADLAVARERLSAMAGRPAESVYVLAETDDLPVPDLDVHSAVQAALSQRVDIAKLRISREKGDIALELQKAQYWPTVSADAGISYNRNWTRDTDQTNWNAGIQLRMPVVDSGTIAAQIRQAELQNRSVDVQIEQLVSGIAADVKDALNGLSEAVARADLSQKSLELARDQYELAKAQFESNSISTLDLLGASVALTGAEVNFAKAKGDVQLGVLALQNAMGN